MRTLTRTSLFVAVLVTFGFSPVTILSQNQQDEWARGYSESQARKAAPPGKKTPTLSISKSALEKGDVKVII